VRLAILISFAAFGLTFSAAWADGPLVRAALGSHVGFIVPEGYAGEHKADLIASIPGLVNIDGFWTPSEQDAAVADRVFLDLIRSAVKNPAPLFPTWRKIPIPPRTLCSNTSRRNWPWYPGTTTAMRVNTPGSSSTGKKSFSAITPRDEGRSLGRLYFYPKGFCSGRNGPLPAMPVQSRNEDLLERVNDRTVAEGEGKFLTGGT